MGLPGLPPPRDRRNPEARILLVEDHDNSRQMYRDYLQFQGFTVHEARTGWEALILAKSVRPDVIVMDLNLPGLDGWTATRHLRAHAGTRHIPIIAVSGYTLLDGEGKARNAGVDVFLSKPCLPEDLFDEIRRLLE